MYSKSTTPAKFDDNYYLQHYTHNHHQHHNQHNRDDDQYAKELAQCHYDDSKIMLSLILDQHNHHHPETGQQHPQLQQQQALDEDRREKILNKFSKFFAIPKVRFPKNDQKHSQILSILLINHLIDQ